MKHFKTVILEHYVPSSGLWTTAVVTHHVAGPDWRCSLRNSTAQIVEKDKAGTPGRPQQCGLLIQPFYLYVPFLSVPWRSLIWCVILIFHSLLILVLLLFRYLTLDRHEYL